MTARSQCFACGSSTLQIKFEVLIHGKHCGRLLGCQQCGSCLFEDPYWLEESYVSAITDMDTGIVQRCLDVRNVLTLLLPRLTRKGTYVDFGGGTGLLARLMRDRGFEFTSEDPFAMPAFPGILDADSKSTEPVAISAIEVFEHLIDPGETFDALLSRAPYVVFTTLLIQPDAFDKSHWYLQPETGQHISFTSREGLEALANRLGAQLVVLTGDVGQS